ncbi:folate family ECF transporter S component [Vagococcus entomophilus]|nr:folate family ECF transporter S component [Vagococcus entomophilus]
MGRSMKKLNVRVIALMGLMIALQVVFTRFLSVETTFLRIGIDFIPATIMGALFGPFLAAIGGGLADVLGMMIFPKGAFFLGFTFNACLIGMLYGLLYYKKELTWKRVIFSTIVITLLSSLLLTPFWLHLMYKVPFWGLMPIRLLKAVVMIPLQAVLTFLVLGRLPKEIKK